MPLALGVRVCVLLGVSVSDGDPVWDEVPLPLFVPLWVRLGLAVNDGLPVMDGDCVTEGEVDALDVALGV